MIRKIIELVTWLWLPVVLILWVIIGALSLLPLPNVSVPGTDKTHHFIAYAALVFPLALAKPKGWGWVLLSMACFAGMVEVVQPLVNRNREWLDMAANLGGMLVGWSLARVLVYIFKPPLTP